MRFFFWMSLFLFAACAPVADDDDSSGEDLSCPLSSTSWEVDAEGEDGQIHPRSIRVGDSIIVSPSGVNSKVSGIDTFNGILVHLYP